MWATYCVLDKYGSYVTQISHLSNSWVSVMWRNGSKLNVGVGEDICIETACSHSFAHATLPQCILWRTQYWRAFNGNFWNFEFAEQTFFENLSFLWSFSCRCTMSYFNMVGLFQWLLKVDHNPRLPVSDGCCLNPNLTWHHSRNRDSLPQLTGV